MDGIANKQRIAETAMRHERAAFASKLTAFFIVYIQDFADEEIKMVHYGVDSWYLEASLIHVLTGTKWQFTGITPDEGTATKLRATSKSITCEEATPANVEVMNASLDEWLDQRQEPSHIVVIHFDRPWGAEVENSIRKLAWSGGSELFICTLPLNLRADVVCDSLMKGVNVDASPLEWYRIEDEITSTDGHYCLKGVPDLIMETAGYSCWDLVVLNGFLSERLMDPTHTHTQTLMTIAFKKAPNC